MTNARRRYQIAELFLRGVMQRYSGEDDNGNEESFADAACAELRAWKKAADGTAPEMGGPYRCLGMCGDFVAGPLDVCAACQEERR